MDHGKPLGDLDAIPREELADLVRYLHGLINAPEIIDFRKAVEIEAAHQRLRRGETDAEKSPEDWLFVVGYLATKATQAARYGDRERYLHHIVTTAAALANWHRHAVAADAQL
jgi:hypothetical protein